MLIFECNIRIRVALGHDARVVQAEVDVRNFPDAVATADLFELGTDVEGYHFLTERALGLLTTFEPKLNANVVQKMAVCALLSFEIFFSLLT